jgi:hypothetical protein
LSAGGTAGDGDGAGGVGTKGYSIGTASVGDSFTIGSTTNRLHISIDGDSGPYITLYSGSSLDPRFVARDITEKMHALGKSDESWDNAVCKWENHPAYGNRFKIYSGSLQTGSTVVVATSGTNTAHAVLGFTTKSESGGTVENSTGASNTFEGSISVSGTYYGFFDETYKIVITNDNDATRGIGTPVKSISYDGTLTTGGVYNYTADTTYTITIDVTNGTTMGQGTGNVPIMTWTAAASADDSTANTELLYPDTWYNVGTRGLMVKFTDAVFGNGTWDIPCYKPDYTSGSNVTDPVGTAYFAYSSDRGDMGAAAATPASGTYGTLGTRGLSFTFNIPASGTDLAIRDEFYVICSAPAPDSYNITSLNYGNVTVSTESDVKCVMFEIESGAAQMSSVKFGLQNHGSFSHHNAGNSDTYFRFGTVGPENTATSPAGGEWYPNITAADIDSDTPPAYLYATEDNLSVVSTADASEDVGNVGLTADPVWLNIRLGSSETGANSTINYRLYFDYS